MSDKNHLKIEIELPFSNRRLAQVAYDVLRVDGEPKRGGVSKELSINEHILKVKFSAELARQLRVAVNGFFEKVDLISETIEVFGQPFSESYSHY